MSVAASRATGTGFSRILARLVTRWLGKVGAEACQFYLPPLEAGEIASLEDYLPNLLRSAPPMVFLTHLALCLGTLVVCCLGSRRLLFPSRLSPAVRERAVSRALSLPWYLGRIACFAARGNALMMLLADSRARARLLPPPLLARDRVSTEAPGGDSAREPSARTRGSEQDRPDFIVVGSGAAGATAALELARAGAKVRILEEGPWLRTRDYRPELHFAVTRLFRAHGTQAARGRSIIPVLQGAAVGGSTVINGGIVHRLPREIHAEWEEMDPAIREFLPFDAIDREIGALEEELGVRANWADQPTRLPATRAMERLGWTYQGMRRNAPGCEGSGRCLQGCPSGGKLSMEASLIPAAVELGAKLSPLTRVHRIETEGGRASGVVATSNGRTSVIRSRSGVILAAGAIETPLTLLRSGIAHPWTGRRFQAHLGVGMGALLGEARESVEGPVQGIEAFLPSEPGIKLATQLVPPELALSRAALGPGELARLLPALDRVSTWTASIRAEARGEVRLGPGAGIRLRPSHPDLCRALAGLRALALYFREIGAKEVFPGIHGLPPVLSAEESCRALESPLRDSRQLFLSAGHLFGTCRLGSRAGEDPVDPGFEARSPGGRERRVFVVDASVFPSSIGVNPQLVIMAIARLAARRIGARG